MLKCIYFEEEEVWEYVYCNCLALNVDQWCTVLKTLMKD